VEKYSEQQKDENMNSELTSKKRDAKSSTTIAQEKSKAIIHNDKETRGLKRGGSKIFPTWLLVLLMAVFGSVMALPLLSVDMINLH
jgi:ubiquitin-conjugating enzyme E2 J2